MIINASDSRFIELIADMNKVFYNAEQGDISKGVCIPIHLYSDDIKNKYAEMEIDEDEAEQLATAFFNATNNNLINEEE